MDNAVNVDRYRMLLMTRAAGAISLIGVENL